MPIVEVPGMGEVEFPDGMSNDAIAAAIKQNMPSPSRASDPALYSKSDAAKNSALNLGKQAARAVGLAGRTIVNTAAALPGAAADFGVGARNLLTGGDTQSPSQMFQDQMTAAGVPTFDTPIEKAGDVIGQMLLGSKIPTPQASQMAPQGFANPTMQQQALARARAEGYSVPPATTNPSMLNRTLESIGGKVAMEQDASLANQKITDSLVKKGLGLDAATDMSESVLPGLRTAAAAPYKALRGAGTMRADSEYGKALDRIAGQYTGAAKDFPDLARNDVLAAIESVRKPAWDADSAMDAIAILRDKSSTAYTQGDKALGKAYKEVSGAMESAIERSLGRRGKDAEKLLAEFRDARQLIAKTYTAEKALNPQVGSFNASKFASELAKGKPLTGEMKKVGEFAQAFPKAAKLMLDSGSVRNTDVILGAGTAAISKEPSLLLYPFVRQAIRKGLLSQYGQEILGTPGIQPKPELAQAINYGLLAQ